jgi:RES domain
VRTALGRVGDPLGALRDLRDAAARALGRRNYETWWRVGYHESPLDFVPRDLCSWEHRFDDPEREYRTLYCAAHRLTAIRETLQDLRPDPNTRADFAQFQLDQGVLPADLFQPAREVTVRWRSQHILVAADIQRHDPNCRFADLDDVAIRNELERVHADLLRRYGMEHLNISEIRSKNRAVTQQIGRDLFERGAAGVLFRSDVDDQQCIALFEERGWLEDTDEAWVSLADEVPELRQVCAEFDLLLRDQL